MKKLGLATVIVVFLLFVSNGIQCQTTQTKLNQVELMKQFVGNWKSDAFQDSVWTGEFKLYGKALEWTSKTTVKDKVVREGKGIMGYDKKNDKLIECDINKTTSEITLYSDWFTAPTKFTGVNYRDVSYPEKASFVIKLEFKSPDLMTETDSDNNKVVGTYTFHRIK
jgi:hypothetical protein